MAQSFTVRGYLAIWGCSNRMAVFAPVNGTPDANSSKRDLKNRPLRTSGILPFAALQSKPPKPSTMGAQYRLGGLKSNGTKTYVSGGAASKKSIWRCCASIKCSNRFHRHAMSAFLCVSNLMNWWINLLSVQIRPIGLQTPPTVGDVAQLTIQPHSGFISSI